MTWRTRNAPRSLTEAGIRAVRTKLANTRHSAWIAAMATDDETERFANQLAAVFASAGWTISRGHYVRYPVPQIAGIVMSGHNAAALLSAANALDAAGLSYSLRYESPACTAEVEIIVGPQPL